MKKFIIPTALFAVGLMTVSIPAHAIDLAVSDSAKVDVQQKNDNDIKMNDGRGLTRDEMKNLVLDEKDRLKNINQMIMNRAQEFKQNLGKIKSAPIGEKKTFIIKAYSDTYTFLIKTHNQFVIALDKAEAKGIEVTEARAHFATAWRILTTANTDLQTFTKMDVQTATLAEAKTLAKKIEAGYIEARQEMREGAEASRTAIKAYTAAVDVDVDSQ